MTTKRSQPRTSLSRRAFLCGAGALLALPALESLAGRVARADTPAAPRRLLAFYVPNGIHMAAWTPAVTGAAYALTPILEPLAPHKSDVLVLSGLDNAPGESDGAGDHASGTGSFLTCRHVRKTDGADISNGISMDQVAAAALGGRFASLQLGVDGGASVGGCDSGYSCAYTRNISWAGPSTPLPKLVEPRAVFDLLFAGYDPNATAAERERRKRAQQSIIDSVKGQVDSLGPRLGQRDREKLDEYFTGIRAIEQRINTDEAAGACAPGDRPPASVTLVQRIDLMIDLMVKAFECDLTRVTSFMLANAASGRDYGFVGAPGAHHQLSHHLDRAENHAKLTIIDRWEVAQLAKLLAKLEAVTDVDGKPLLDNCAVFFSSEIEDGNKHRHRNLPVLVAGKAGGALRSGRHVRYPSGTPMANLFISLLNAVGVPATTFGDDGTGPLADLA